MPIVRRVTTDECSHYREHGWVVLREFVDAALMDQLKTIASDSMGEYGDKPVRSVFGPGVRMWQRYDEPWIEHPQFAQLGRSSEFGVEVAQLTGREAGIRYLSDQIAVKVPAVHGTTAETPWHQDHPYLPIDRVDDLTCWVAMHDMSPEQGTMRFLDRSHREGPLEPSLHQEELRSAHSELWARYAVTDPLWLRTGDATVHNGCLIHGAPHNTAAACRWAYISEYIPADAMATRLPTRHTDKANIAEGGSFDHLNFPLFRPRTVADRST